MAVSKKKVCLLFTTIYSFFICFLFNVFGWVLSYRQLTYQWNVLNIHEARRVVFNYALLHFGLFALCCFFYLRTATLGKKHAFAPLRGTETGFEQSLRSSQSQGDGY